MEKKSLKTLNYLLFGIIVLAGAFYIGCGIIEEPLERVWFEPKPYTNRLPRAYREIELKRTTSAEVLENIKKYKPELLSQSKSVVASWGEKKETYQFWLTMVAFDEETSAVARKYFLAVDEKPWHIHAEGQKLRFDTQMIFDEKTLSAPYTSENEKRIAMLKKVQENTRDNIMEVRQDSRVLNEGAMMINQTFERILYVLKESPGLAARLSEPNGLDFDHLTLGKSRVGLSLNNDIVKVKIRIGSVKKLWKQE
jgi:hypothetical protein